MSDNTFIRHVDVLNKPTSQLAIHQEKIGDVGCVVWDAALVLAYYIQTQKAKQRFIHNKNVIELGAGTGIVGLVAACCGAKNVILSDLPELLPLLRKNIKENETVLKLFGSIVSEYQLQWGSTNDMDAIIKSLSMTEKESEKHNFHCVLLADCVYYDEAVELLAMTINHVISGCGNDTVVLCSFEDRDTGNKQELQERFRCILKDKYKLQIEYVPFSEMHEEFRSHDIHILCISQSGKFF